MRSCIPEASGIVKSRRYADIFWVHNDSGNPPLLFAIRGDGRIVRQFRLAIPNIDWEDIAIDDQGHLYLGDIGNNTRALPLRAIYRIDEPDPNSRADKPISASAVTFYDLPAENRFDAESLFYDRGSANLVAKYLDGREAELFTVPLEPPSPLLRPAQPRSIGRLQRIHRTRDGRRSERGWNAPGGLFDGGRRGFTIVTITNLPHGGFWPWSGTRPSPSRESPGTDGRWSWSRRAGDFIASPRRRGGPRRCRRRRALPSRPRAIQRSRPQSAGTAVMTEVHDVVIVGGGVIGLSIAFALAREGIRPTVVDRRDLGREASWAGAGLIPPVAENRSRQPLVALRSWSAELYPSWSAALGEETGIDVGYRRTGGVDVAWTDLEDQELRATAGRWRAEGIAYERLAPGDYARVEPALNPELKAVYYLPDRAQVRNPWLLRALMAAVSRRGGRLMPWNGVEGFRVQDRRVTAVRTSVGDLPCGMVVVAAGAWSGSLLETIGVDAPTPPIKGQIVLLRGERPLIRRVVEHGKNYLVPRDDGRVLVGATEEECRVRLGADLAGHSRASRSGRSTLPRVERSRSRSDMGRASARKL